MKTTTEFLAYLKSLDIQLWVNGDKLHYSTPTGTLTPTLLGQIKEYKPEIIKLLQNTTLDSSYSTGAIVPVTRDTDIPLSFAQQRLWLIEQIAGNSAIYNESGVVKISGSLQIAVLQQSFAEIVQRHEVLRTSFKNVDGQPIQEIAPNLNITVPVVDWRSLTKTEQELEVQRLIAEEAKRPFDLTQAPLLRVTLLQLEETEYLLQLTIHHILADFWAINLLLDEFTLLYQAFAQGKASPLPPLPIQYADFTVWQRQYLQTDLLETELAYWKQQLHNAPNLLQLPIERSRPPIQTYPGKIHNFSLSKTLTESLKATSRSVGATLFMTLLATFKTLLYRYTGQEDILVGSPIANRNRAEIEKLIGIFANTLVLRTSLSGNPSFRELLIRVREVTLNAYTHQNLPFEKLVEELQLPRDLSYSQLFQVMFSFLNVPQTSLEIPGLTLEILPTHNQTSRFDLTLEFAETESGLIGEVEYNTDLFDAATISSMVGHLETLLTAVAANPDQRLLELPILTPKEENQLLVEWNQTQVDYPQQSCIHQLFEQQVELTPDAIALVFEDEQLTYRELNTKANQLAHYLQKLGVKPETLVGICIERSIEMIVGLLGILKAGGAYVPLDPAYPPERLEFMLADAQVPILLTQASLLTTLPTHSALVVCLDTDWDKITLHSPQNPTSNVKIGNAAYVIYTSGSTGQPKGVLVNHSNIVRLFAATQAWYNFNSQDVWTLFHSYAFDFSVWEIWGALIYGGKLVVVPYLVSRSPEEFYQLLCEERVTVLNQTPSAFRQLIKAEESLGISPELNLRLVIFGGEALELPSLKPWFDQHGDQWPQLVNMYGITETTVHVTYRPLTMVDLNNTASVIGRPIPDLQIYLLDQHFQLVPVGVPGEIYVGGAGVTRGYLNRPDLTKEKFIPHPFSQKLDSRLYKTGDLARYLSNGDIEYLGRVDYQVKLRGFRIELGEIESVLSQHPDIREVVVIVHSDQADFQRLVAYLVPRSKQDLAISELRQFLELQLPDYMIPNVFFTLEALPLTPNGKVNRKALPAPDPIQLSPKTDFVPPSSPVEEILAGIWADVLGLEKVGIHNNFFQLGGHSLIATRVISRIRQVFLQELPLRRLFELPTVAQLAKEIKKSSKSGTGLEIPSIKPHFWTGELPLSFAQQRLWFLTQLEPDSPFYNIPIAVRLQGQLNYDVLEQSFHTIVQRHKTLQTNFQTVAGQPIAFISPTRPIQLNILDLSALPTQQRETEIKQLVLAEAQSPFDLNHDFLLRVKLLNVGEKEHILLLTIHHIIADGWSIGVVMREVSQLYTAFCAGQTPTMPELPIQYTDFASWQRQWLKGEVLQEQILYWRKHLEALPPKLELPTDRPRPAVQTFQGAIHAFTISPELTIALNMLSQQTGSTLFMTLLTAFKVLLGRYTNSTDIVVGTPIANRNQGETEQLVGLFVNTLVLRTDLSGDLTFRELLGRLREVALGAYAHQDLPFEQLVEELQPQRSLSHTPLFQVMFVLQNAPMSALKLAGLTVSAVETELGSAKFDLTLYMEQEDSGLRAAFEYNTDLFDASTISRMAGHLETLLTAITANPDQRLLELPILTPKEENQLLVKWNQTQVDYPQQSCIHQLFEQQVELTPDAIALVFENEQLTYRELNTKANQLAHYLQKLGVKPETLVGICIERSIEMVVGLLGILKAGGAYVPLDPAYPPERIAFMLADAQVPILLTQTSLLETLPTHSAQVICLDTDWDKITLYNPQNPQSSVTSENLIYVIYTSGSTGNPKGAMNTHKGLCNRLLWMQDTYKLTPQDRVLQKTPFSFDVSVWEFFWTLITGAKLVIAQPGGHQDSAYLVQLIAREQITTVHFVPAMLQVFLEESGLETCRCLKRVICSGEALPKTLQDRFFALLDADLHNLYGPTEAAIDVTFWQCQPHSQLPFVPIGRPISNTQIYILDGQGKPTPVGVPGELHIGGVGLARGYLNRPDLTNEKFIPHPFSQELDSRLYKTGDLARYLSNGDIEYLGRVDYQVKLRGFRIELGEIESVLSQHPDVREVVVLAREDLPGEKRLVGYVIRNGEDHKTGYFLGELRSFLKEKLPDYMVPSAFVILDALPLTANGKVDRRSLPAPDATRPDLATAFIPPHNSVEEALAGIWSHVLRREPIGIQDNFFELGGDSILSLQIIFLAHRAGLQLTPKQLFQHQTIAELATVVGKNQLVQPEQGLVIGTHPHTPIQQWFFEQEFLEPYHWNQAVLLEVRQPLNTMLLEQALQHLLVHHDALRMRFERLGDSWRQVNGDLNADVPFTKIKLSTLSEIEVIATQLQASLNLSQGSLVRVCLFDLGANQSSRLLLVIHHLVVDGVSWRILLEDLQTVYEQLILDQVVHLPPKTTSFQDWSKRLTDYAQSEKIKSELDYWLRDAYRNISKLPVDYLGGENIEASVSTVSIFLTVEETQLLLQEVPQAYKTQINDVLLTALVQSFRRWTGTESLLVELEGHGREAIFDDVDLSRTVGWFTNLFPILLELKQTSDLGEELKSIKEQLRRIPNRGIGYGLLRYLSQDGEIKAQLREMPQAEVVFNYLGQIDQVFSNSALFLPTKESCGLTYSLKASRSHVLAVNGIVVNSQLRMDWTYSQNIHKKTTVEQLAQYFLERLRSLIAHCQSSHIGGFTPSDFPLAQFDQKELDAVLAMVEFEGGAIG